ncbi:hypothetical protein QQP08_003356, partial [Theobroma cacao]
MFGLRRPPQHIVTGRPSNPQPHHQAMQRQQPDKQQAGIPTLAGIIVIYKNGESNCTDCGSSQVQSLIPQTLHRSVAVAIAHFVVLLSTVWNQPLLRLWALLRVEVLVKCKRSS